MIEQFVWSRLLLAFDYDGTLAPIVSTPVEARVRGTTARLAREAAALFPCAVVSSRRREDIARRVRDLGPWAVWSGGPRPSPEVVHLVSSWKVGLLRALSGFHGVEIEDKVDRLTVHFRTSRQKRAVIAAVRAAAGQLPGARVVRGHQVLHVQPQGVPDKGLALKELMAQQACDAAIYVGDDETDEHAFAQAELAPVLSVRVGTSRSSRAFYFISRQEEVDDLLALLINTRRMVGQRSIPKSTARGATLAGGHEESGDLLDVLLKLDHQRQVQSRALDAAWGITSQQRVVLRLVGRFPGITPGRIAERLCLDPSALSPIIKVLSERGWVTRDRDPTHPRRQWLGLTESGRRFDVPVEGTLDHAVRCASELVPKSDLAAARRVLGLIVQGLTISGDLREDSAR